MNEIITDFLAEAQARMKKSVEATRAEFSTVRTGRDRVAVKWQLSARKGRKTRNRRKVVKHKTPGFPGVWSASVVC